jgi:hypothetical protein
VREDGRRRKTSGTHTSLRGERKYNNIYVCVYIYSWYELFSYSHTYSVIYLREIKNCNGRYGSK